MTPEELERIRARLAATTPAPWVAERTWNPEADVHFTIRTRDPLPAHPWSARYIAWLTGTLKPDLNAHAEPRRVKCEACGYVHYNHRALQVGVDVRCDPESEADAEFLAHAPEDVAALLAEVERLNERLRYTIEAREENIRHATLHATERSEALEDEVNFQRDINQQLGAENTSLRAVIASQREVVQVVARMHVGGCISPDDVRLACKLMLEA